MWFEGNLNNLPIISSSINFREHSKKSRISIKASASFGSVSRQDIYIYIETSSSFLGSRESVTRLARLDSRSYGFAKIERVYLAGAIRGWSEMAIALGKNTKSTDLNLKSGMNRNRSIFFELRNTSFALAPSALSHFAYCFG